MKNPSLAIASIFFLFQSCAQEQVGSNHENSYSENQGTVQEVSQKASDSKIIWYEVMDQKTGMVSRKVPMPSSWKVRTPTQDDPSGIHGPDGFKSYTFTGQSYIYTQDQFMAQSYAQAGVQMRAPATVETMMREVVVKNAEGEGQKMTAEYHMPALAQYDKNYASKLYGAQNFQSRFDAYVTEWVDKEGKPSLCVMRYHHRTSMGMTYWGFSLNGMEADPGYYAQAKKEYFNALINAQDNPAQIAQFNASEQRKEQQSWSQHNQRIQANQRNFDASQQAYRTRQEASDIQMQTWRNTTNMQDQGHSNYINSINETQVMTNPTTGQTYQVDAGANQTWMNANGEYIQSDDYFYDPNMDPNLNNQNWQQMTEGDR